MGQRGVLRQPGSVRAEREGGVSFDVPEPINVPKWLSRSGKAEFKKLVDELTQANVPIKQIDSSAIGMTAYCVASVAEWVEHESAAITLDDKLKCSERVTRYSRDCQKWLDMIGASPAARARLGLKAKPKDQGRMAQLIAMKKANDPA